MAAEWSGAGFAGHGSAAAAAAAVRPAFMSQSLADRRAEVEAWSVDQADSFCLVIVLGRLGLSGSELWNISPAEIPISFGPSFESRIDAMRTRDYPQSLNDRGCGIINAAVQFIRNASSTSIIAAAPAAAGGAAGRAATASPSAPAAAAAASSSAAASVMRGPDSSYHGPAATRGRFASSNISGDEEDSNGVLSKEWRSVQPQHQRRKVQPAAAVSNAPAAPSIALYRRLPSSSNDPTPRAAPLRVDVLPQDWFVDPVPGALICCICMEVARDPPNLEVCGQLHSHVSHCCPSLLTIQLSASVAHPFCLRVSISQATLCAATV